MWLEVFEIMLVILFFGTFTILLVRKDHSRIGELINGTIFGVMLEYLNIYIFEGYRYHSGFFLQIGAAPNNVPLAIGMAWGLLGIYTTSLVSRYHLPSVIRLIFAALIAVSYDLLLDIIAVRLEGGFWVWAGYSLDYEITLGALYGIPWGNFIGWFLVMFYLGLFNGIVRTHLSKLEGKVSIYLIRIVGVPICANLSLLASLIVLGLLGIQNTLGWVFACIFLGGYVLVTFYLVKTKFHHTELHSPLSFAFFVAIYAFVGITSVSLNLWQAVPGFLAIGFAFGGLILFMDLWSTRTHSKGDTIRNTDSQKWF